MSLISVLKEYPLNQIGTSSGNYLNFEEGTNRWSVVQLNCLERFIRWLGFWYSSTNLEFVARKLSLTEETNLDVSVLNTIYALWNKAFPTEECPLKKTVAPFRSLDVANPSRAQNIAAETFKVENTSISIEGANLTEPGVECVLLPAMRKSYFMLSFKMEELFEEISTAVGRNLELEVKALGAKSLETEVSLPSITQVGNLSRNGIRRILLPKIPSGTFSEKEPNAIDRYALFLLSCLDLAKNEGVRSLAFSPLNFERSQNSEWTRIDLEVIEFYVQAHPEAFDTIKLRYKFDTEESAADLVKAITICRSMPHPFIPK